MSNNFRIDKEFLLKTAKDILEFNSPTGFCFEIMDKIEEIIAEVPMYELGCDISEEAVKCLERVL